MGYDVSDGEPVEAYTERTRKARKKHICSCCGLAIVPGEKYDDITYIYDGRPERVKRCPSCSAVYAHLLQKRKECGDSYVAIDFTLSCGLNYRDEWDDDPPEHIAALAFRLPGEPVPPDPEPTP